MNTNAPLSVVRPAVSSKKEAAEQGNLLFIVSTGDN